MIVLNLSGRRDYGHLSRELRVFSTVETGPDGVVENGLNETSVDGFGGEDTCKGCQIKVGPSTSRGHFYTSVWCSEVEVRGTVGSDPPSGFL